MNEDNRTPETNVDDLNDEQLDEVAGGRHNTLPPTYTKPDQAPGGTPFGSLAPWLPIVPEDPQVHPVPHTSPTTS